MVDSEESFSHFYPTEPRSTTIQVFRQDTKRWCSVEASFRRADHARPDAGMVISLASAVNHKCTTAIQSHFIAISMQAGIDDGTIGFTTVSSQLLIQSAGDVFCSGRLLDRAYVIRSDPLATFFGSTVHTALRIASSVILS